MRPSDLEARVIAVKKIGRYTKSDNHRIDTGRTRVTVARSAVSRRGLAGDAGRRKKRTKLEGGEDNPDARPRQENSPCTCATGEPSPFRFRSAMHSTNSSIEI